MGSNSDEFFGEGVILGEGLAVELRQVEDLALLEVRIAPRLGPVLLD